MRDVVESGSTAQRACAPERRRPPPRRGGRSVASAIRTLVVLDAGLTHDQILSSLPEDAAVDIVSVVEGMDAAGRALESTDCDVLLIACEGYSDRVLYLIESAVNQDEERPVIVLCQGSSNGFVHRVFEAGAEDIAGAPAAAPDRLVHDPEGAGPHAAEPALDGADPGRLIVVLGPKGGTGKTLTSTNLAVALQTLASASRSSTSTSSSATSALCARAFRPDETIYDLRASGGTSTRASSTHYLATHVSGVRALLAPSRPDQASAVSVESVREVYALLRERRTTP